MAEQTGRQTSRFRIPFWNNIQPTPNDLQPPTQPTIPTQRQLFRSSTTLQPPAQPQPQPQPAPTRTQSQAPFPSRTASQTQFTTRIASQPPSPSRQASQLQQKTPTVSQPPSPSRQVPRPQAVTRTASQPPSPSRTTSKPQAQNTSPSRTSQPQSTTRTTSQPPSSSRQTSPLQPKSPTTPQPPSPSRTASEHQPQTTSSSPTSQLQSTNRTGSQPPSPSRQAPRSQAVTRTASQPPSPSRTGSKPPSPSRANSKPPSPSPQVTQIQTVTQTSSPPRSPSRTITQTQHAAQTTSPPQLPSRKATQTQPTAQTATPLQSPSHKAAQTQPTLTRMLPDDPQNQEETSPQPSLQYKAQLLSSLETPDQTPTQPISQPVTLANQPTMVLESEVLVEPTSSTHIPKTFATLQSSEAAATFHNPTQPLKSETKLEATIDETRKPKPERDQRKQPKVPTNEEPKKMMDTKLLDMVSGQSEHIGGQSGVSSRDITETTIVQPEQVGKQAVLDKKEAASIGSQGKESKIATITNTRDRKDRKAESKTDLRASISSPEPATLHKEIKEGASILVNQMVVGNQEQLGDEHNVSVITLAGENKGSSMHVGSDAGNKDAPMHIHRGYKLNKNDKAQVSSEEGEGTSSNPVRKLSKKPAITACINSNIQIINNSILYNSSCSVRNPGVHLLLSSNPAEPHKLKGKVESYGAQKADFNISSGQNLTNKPTVKRRCLRGLFLESSDSEADNPQKARRHGCRYNCPDNKKGKDREGNSSTTNGTKEWHGTAK